MKILYEDTMPHAHAFLSQLGEVQAYSWQQLQPQDLVDIDVLAVRSTTKITAELLSQANRLHTIATATAGTNHMNIPLLEERGLNWYAAGGCNAEAVAQYVVSALMYAQQQQGLNLTEIRVGIVGAGNVGTALANMLDALHIGYVLCDPPIAAHDGREFVSLDEVLTCDVISLHVPYVKTGQYPTQHMLDAQRLAKLQPSQWLINACRGEVIDESALLALKKIKQGPKLVLDVWLNEPDINTELMSYVELATAHIAGHTDEGKIRGTQMVFEYLCNRNNDILPVNRGVTNIAQLLPQKPAIAYGDGDISMPLSQFLQRVYDIQFDHRIFTQNMAQSPAFSILRKKYQGRREYSAFTLSNMHELDKNKQYCLKNLGFKSTEL